MDSFLSLRKFVAPEIVTGTDSRTLAGRYARNLGARRAFVVTDPGVVEAGWTDDVIASLESEGVETFTYSGVTPNPRDHEVMAGTEQYLENSCDCVVAVGGGSPIDCAKGIAMVVSNGGHVLDYVGADRIGAALPPLICVPTTAGTSADVSQFAIIVDTATHIKRAIVSKGLVPDVSLLDPTTLTTMDAELTAYTGMDALAHAVEAYASNASSPLTDTVALSAVSLIGGSLADAIAGPHDLRARAHTMMGSLHAGLAFSNASLGMVHAMAHALGGVLDLPHGQCNALLLPAVCEFNAGDDPHRYDRIASILGDVMSNADWDGSSATMTECLRELSRRVGITGGLADLGMTAADIPVLASAALCDVCVVTNPRPPRTSDIERVYESSL